MKNAHALSVAALLALAGGCSNSSIDHASANKVMTAALAGTGQAQTMASSTSSTSGGSLDITLTNPNGGTAHVTGTQSNSNGFSLNFDITFSKWTDKADNITLDGTLHETSSFTSTAPFTGSATITGDLSASGSVNAAVDFNLTAAYSPTGIKINGNVGGNSINLTVGL